MIGSAIIFPNGNCGTAAESLPPKSLGDSFAVSFVTSDIRASDATEHAREVVSKIAKLKVSAAEFGEQAKSLQQTNIVYADAKYDETLLASWLPSDARSAVPPIILDRVVGVPLEEDAGTTVASGSADATVAGQQDRMDTGTLYFSIRTDSH